MKDDHDSMDAALDAALEMTFPASDPVAVFMHEHDAWDDGKSVTSGPHELPPHC